jgi:hypothetical protein
MRVSAFLEFYAPNPDLVHASKDANRPVKSLRWYPLGRHPVARLAGRKKGETASAGTDV